MQVIQPYLAVDKAHELGYTRFQSSILRLCTANGDLTAQKLPQPSLNAPALLFSQSWKQSFTAVFS